MICYRDRTFCPFYQKCKKASTKVQESQRCDRGLTPEVEERAAAFGLPVALYASEPDCYEEDTE